MTSPAFTSIAITGASSGLGAALAEAYAAEGITLFLCGRNASRLEAVAERCRAKGATTHGTLVDVADQAALTAWVRDSHAICPLDLMLANAGISAGTIGGLEAAEQIQQIFAINVDGVLHSVSAASDVMAPAKHGHIAVISSLASMLPLPSCPSYSASKAAVRHYGYAIASLLKRQGIGMTVILPGYIRTPMTAVNRFPMPGIMDAAVAAERIKNKLAKRPLRIIFPYWLYLFMRLMGMLPIAFTQCFLQKLPGKTPLHKAGK
jgi:short-subunit dehydrogenase